MLLAVMGILAKMIGALYRVPLTNAVGAVGMGLYQTVFPLYTVLLAFCGGGMTTAVSRVVAKYSAVGDPKTAVRTVRIAMIPLFIVSFAATAVALILRNAVSRIQGNPDAGICYLALFPSLLFTGGISVIRGYFQGLSKMAPSGVSQLIEQSVKLVLGMYLAKVLLPFGVKYAVAGALLGVTAGELLALFYLVLSYAVSKRRADRSRRNAPENAEASALPCAAQNSCDASPDLVTETAEEFCVAPEHVSAGAHAKEKNAFLKILFGGKRSAENDAILFRELFSFALPIMFGSLILPATQMLDSVTVVNILVYGGMDRAEATARFGLCVGPIATLINMPTVLSSSVSVAFLPALTGDIERGNDGARLMRKATESVLFITLPVTVAFFAFSKELLSALYSRGLSAGELDTAAMLLRMQAVNVLYLGVLQLGTSILQARGHAHRPVVDLLIGAAVKIVLTPILTHFFGIEGTAAASVALYATAATLTVIYAYRTGGFFASAKRSFILPLILSALGAAAFFGVSVLPMATRMPQLLRAAVETLAFAVVYFGGAAAPIVTKKLKSRRAPKRDT